MDQYRPEGRVGEASYPEINRRLALEEFAEAVRLARSLGLSRLDVRRPHPLLRRRLILM
jgi:uncharacterized Fe-S radical SAM superfamily protein PflX